MANPNAVAPKHTQWKKGQSGNPAGRKKGVPTSKTRLLRLLELTEQLTNPVTGEVEGFSVAEQMDLAQILKARKGDTKAYNAILDRLEGKAQQALDVTSGNEPLKIALVEFVDGDKNGEDTSKSSD